MAFECRQQQQTMSLYYTLSKCHQVVTGTSKKEQSPVDNVLKHVCDFLTSGVFYR